MLLAAALAWPSAASEPSSPRRVLCLSQASADDRWVAELEARLNATPRREPFVVIRRAATDGDALLVDELLDSYSPDFVVTLEPLPERSRRAIAARGLPLRVVPAREVRRGADKAARRILAALGEGAAHGDPAAAQLRRARAHLEASEDNAAEAALNALLALRPDDADALRALIALRRLTRPWAALEAAERLAALAGSSDERRAEDLLAAADLRALVGDAAAAERGYERVLSLRPGDSRALLGLAQGRRARPRDALRLARGAAASAPRSPRAHRIVAEILLDLDERAAAGDSLRRALALAPEDLDTLGLLVRAHGGGPAAAAYAAKAEAVAEKAPAWHRHDAYRHCARMRLELGDDARAAFLYNRALAVEPEDMSSLLELVRLRRDGVDERAPALRPEPLPESPSYDLSEAAAWAALGSSPNDLEALHQLIALRRDQGRLSEASALAKRFHATIPSAPDWQQSSAYHLLARLAWEAGDPARARLGASELDHRVLDQVRFRMRSAGGSLEYKAAEVQAAEARAELGDEQGAAMRLETLLATFPDDLEALRALTGLKASHRRFSEALVWAERFVRASGAAAPESRAKAWSLKARVQLGLKDEAGAEKSLREALRLLPEGPALSSLLHLTRSQRRFAESLSYADKLVAAAAGASAAERAAALVQKAQIQVELSDENGAEKSLREALRLQPAGPALTMLLDLALARKRFSEALPLAESLEAAIASASASERAEAFVQKARIQLELKDEAGAEKSLARALSLAPEGRALPMLLRLLTAQRRYAEALSCAERLERAGAGSPAGERAAVLSEKGRIQLALGDERGAEKSLRAALLLHVDGPALASLLRLAMSQRRFAEALSHAEALEKADAQASPRERAEAAAVKAQIQLALKDEAGAEKSLRRSLRLFPEGPALSSLLDLTRSQRRFAESLSYAERLVSAASRAPASERAAALVMKARIQLELKSEPGAERSLREALTLQPEGPALPMLLELAVSRRRFAEALALAERVEAASAQAPPPERAAALARKARIQLELKDAAGAEKSLLLSARLDPSGSAAPQLLQMAESRGGFAEALSFVEMIEAAGAQGPPRERASLLVRKARLQRALKDDRGARESLERALSLAPGEMDALWMLFDAKRRDPGEALRFVAARGPAAGESKAPWLALLGHARALNRDREGARRDLGEAVALDPEGVCFGALFDQRRGELDTLYFDRCLERFPANAALHSDRGVARYLAGERDAALADFRAAVALEPGHLAAHLNLLSLLAGQDRLREAREAAEEAAAAAGEGPSPIRDRILEIRESLRGTPAGSGYP